MEIHDGNTPGSGMNQPGAGDTGNVTGTQGGVNIDDLLDGSDLPVGANPAPGSSPGAKPQDDSLEAIAIADQAKTEEDLKRANAEYRKYDEAYQKLNSHYAELARQQAEASKNGDGATADQLQDDIQTAERYRDAAKSCRKDAGECVQAIKDQQTRQQQPQGTK